MTARRFLISGLVQGVGYRFFAIRAARERGVGGWVRNLPDGRVEVLAEGTLEALNELLADLRRGPRGARVSAIEESEELSSGKFSDFDVLF